MADYSEPFNQSASNINMGIFVNFEKEVKNRSESILIFCFILNTCNVEGVFLISKIYIILIIFDSMKMIPQLN
jgi:hypothetical protein